jgi:tetratricopeptide (TPR) repeat protein
MARPSILGDDALAWALARTGRCAEARAWSDRSLRLGTRDALIYFHRAEIERCAGNQAEARAWARRAVALDPAFSVRWAPVARRLARA